ncbi:hypothetical protein [Gordonia caeni]|uniref:Uncharacterized protein n=1 Tax=Gordonia caeni TaxID=1007097 RepID=A0ABP7P459_9ACTN
MTGPNPYGGHPGPQGQGYPQQGYPQQGYPQQGGYPPQQPGYPQQGYPQQGYPQQDYGQPGHQQPGPSHQAPHGQAPYGQAPYGQAPYGQAPHGQAPYGQALYGQSPYGQAPGSGGPAVGAGMSPRVHQALWVVAGLGLLAFISVFLPWISGGGESASGMTDGGTDTYGVWVLILGLLTVVLAGVALFFTEKLPVLPLVSGAIAALTGLVMVIVFAVDLNKINDAKANLDGMTAEMSQQLEELNRQLGQSGVAPPTVAPTGMEIGSAFGLWFVLVIGLVLIAAGALVVFFRQFAKN